MQIEIPSNSQIKGWIKREVEKREDKMFKVMDMLNNKILRLEEELQVYRNERRLKK